MSNSSLRRVRVAAVERVADRIKRFELVPEDGAQLAPFSAGSHVVVTMRDGEKVFRNPYSLMGSPFASDKYQISVLHSPASRGGSTFMHEGIHEGSRLEISEPVNLFPLVHIARKHIMIAGGIGITPFLAMLDQLSFAGASYELHYAVRSATGGAYLERFDRDHRGHAWIYRSDLGERIDLNAILANQPLGTHLYVCGPQRMTDWVLETAREEGWPEEDVHCERFLAPPPGEPFLVRLARSGREIRVGEHQSILEALEQAGVDAPFLCRGGACGQCITTVLGAKGKIIHNDHYLNDEEHCRGERIATCVSRLEGDVLTLDL